MIRCILTDIEGTTSSIEFVHNVLFPYARKNFLPFFQTQQTTDVKQLAMQLWTEQLNGAENSEPNLNKVSELLESWVDSDLKNGILKTIQGKIWRLGYESGAYKGHVYPEVKAALESWTKKGLILAVYSSGSIEAQKLLFGHSESGDLTPFFKAFFDTTVGPKRETQSYATIANELRIESKEILFLSDIAEELEAAQKTGMQTCQLLRSPTLSPGTYHTARDFNEVSKFIETAFS